ncbi:MaoC family dehydratase [Pseudomaricurvus alkylphenolicus]|uniref:MaoC family dehydratase n=1 Tax=Pseudomaricurvus alkylphenolicus TaxID=1306991 RepID=UPI001422AC52|nr:MaoC family dehydratase [Pseudomaricurvus alkylphenolicus]NIB38947.1 MaoC family dehydratase [Pseudomaricurvus alkylphenolicus]
MLTIDCNDINALRGQISDDYGPWSDYFQVTQSVIDSFAELSGDRQWIHTDVERAKQSSPYGATIAHGFLILSLMSRVRPPASFNVVNHSSVANYGSKGLRFLAPVVAGSRIHARQKLMAVEEHPKGVLLTSEVAIQAEGSGKPALVYNMSLLYRF